MKQLMKRSVCLLMALLTLHASFPLEASQTDERAQTNHLGETIQPSPEGTTYVTVNDLKTLLQESQTRTEEIWRDLLQRTLRKPGEGEVEINSSTPLMGTNERQGQVRVSQSGSSQDTNPKPLNEAPSSPDQVEIEISDEINDENGEEADDESENVPFNLDEDIKGTKMDNCFKFGMNFWLIAGIVFDVTGIGAVALTAIFTSLSTAVEFFSDQTIHMLRFAALITSLSSTVSIMLKHIAKKTSNDRKKELTNMHREHRRVTRHNRNRQPFEKLQRTARKVFRGQDRRARRLEKSTS